MVDPGCDVVVHFPDPNLETAIRERIGKPTGDIMASDLQVITDLDAPQRSISISADLNFASTYPG